MENINGQADNAKERLLNYEDFTANKTHISEDAEVEEVKIENQKLRLFKINTLVIHLLKIELKHIYSQYLATYFTNLLFCEHLSLQN